jgi:hypothetical protein
MFTGINLVQSKGVTTLAMSLIMVVPHGHPFVVLASSGGIASQLGHAKAKI